MLTREERVRGQAAADVFAAVFALIYLEVEDGWMRSAHICLSRLALNRFPQSAWLSLSVLVSA